MHLENRELSIYVSFASWHVRILLRNTLRMEKALDKHWYWYWYFGSSLLNTDFISTFHSAFFLTKSPFPSFQGYLQKTVVISFCTLELTPPILYSPIVFMPARQRKKGNSGIETRNKDFFVKLRISYVTARQWMKHIVIHNHKRAALRSFDKWKLRDLNASPLVSTRSMHFLIKLKPASLRNAVTQHENRVDTSITVG